MACPACRADLSTPSSGAARHLLPDGEKKMQPQLLGRPPGGLFACLCYVVPNHLVIPAQAGISLTQTVRKKWDSRLRGNDVVV